MARFAEKSRNFGIILDNIKNERNIGTLARTFANFQADFVATVNYRYKRSCGDTINSVSQIPFFNFENWKDCKLKIPGWPIIGVELTENAKCITKFTHPRNAIYAFGPEDGNLSKDIQKYCSYMIKIPSFHCLNISVAAGIVIYDRLIKSQYENM